MKIGVALLFVSLLVPVSVQAISLSKCETNFPYNKGWLGADAAYSVSLGGDRILWLFGDTFIGETTQKTRKGAKMIANSLGLIDCGEKRPNISYVWGHDKNLPTAFFQTEDKEIKYWPLDAFVSDGKLYVLLAQIHSKPDATPLGFEYYGVTLATISNPSMVPQAWQISYSELIKSTRYIPGVSAVLTDTHVYLFTAIEDDLNKGHPIILTRLPLYGLKKPADYLEYYAKDKNWKKGDLKDALKIMATGATEMSIRLHPEVNRWVAVYTKPGLPAKEIGMRVSSDLEGPWSEAATIYKFPEADSNNREYDPDMFCYAAKEHVELETKKNIKLTYVCNYTEFQKQVSDLKNYRPKTVTLPAFQLHHSNQLDFGPGE